MSLPLDRRAWLKLGGLNLGALVTGAGPSDRAMDSNCLLATIYHRFGIDPPGAFVTGPGARSRSSPSAGRSPN